MKKLSTKVKIAMITLALVAAVIAIDPPVGGRAPMKTKIDPPVGCIMSIR